MAVVMAEEVQLPKQKPAASASKSDSMSDRGPGGSGFMQCECVFVKATCIVIFSDCTSGCTMLMYDVGVYVTC